MTSLHSDSQGHQDKKVIVYFLTCACVDFVAGKSPHCKICMACTVPYESCSLAASCGAMPASHLMAHGQAGWVAMSPHPIRLACSPTCAAVLPRLSQCKGMTINALHGRMKQAARAATLAAFTEVPAGTLGCVLGWLASQVRRVYGAAASGRCTHVGLR